MRRDKIDIVVEPARESSPYMCTKATLKNTQRAFPTPPLMNHPRRKENSSFSPLVRHSVGLPSPPSYGNRKGRAESVSLKIGGEIRN